MSLPPKRLKRLLRQRELLERVQQRELAEALALRNRRAAALEESRATREAVLDLPLEPGPLDPADLLARAAAIARLDREIAARGAALAHSDGDVAEEREALMERRRDRRALETLLERRLAAERLERARAQARQLDDFAAARWRPAFVHPEVRP
ncbi:flagellar export protein FliJ [Tepidiforma sp.]|uniref:flagellar export protein FliJ n=1 Tax=Tepidiforma sp. TaxID=2682230 RepID=UPI002ADE18A7|nr:flagellar export protein FliJ [Tepidiforma sp.]